MYLSAPVGLAPRLIGNGKALLDQNQGNVAFRGNEGRQGPTIAIRAAGPFDRDLPLKKLAQASGGQEAFCEFGVAAGFRDFWSVRFDEANALAHQLDCVAINDADQGAVDRLCTYRESGEGEYACEEDVFHGPCQFEPVPSRGAARG